MASLSLIPRSTALLAVCLLVAASTAHAQHFNNKQNNHAGSGFPNRTYEIMQNRYSRSRPTPINTNSGFGNRSTIGTSQRVTASQAANQPTPIAPNQAERSLTMKSLAGTKFVNAKKFLKEKSVQFAAPEKFLMEKRSAKTQHSGKSSTKPVTMRFASTNKNGWQEKTLESQQTFESNDGGADDQQFSVSDVRGPISDNPFAQIQQFESSGLGLLTDDQIALPSLYVNSYSELTGQGFQPHFARFSAHNFRHHPLYFEEVNLERYGNELKLQPAVSAAHFFASAALFPYRYGQHHGRTCVSTLGHRRPGECVPYQIHRGPRSPRGLIYQGVIVTAAAL